MTVMTIQGFGFLLPMNLRGYSELRKPQPDMAKIQRPMRLYIRVVASQAIMQFTIIFFTVAKFATGGRKREGGGGPGLADAGEGDAGKLPGL